MNRDHWEAIHATKQDQVSWYQDRPSLALTFIQACDLAPGATVLDAGAGASRMVESLLDLGLRPTVADIAQSALDRVRERLGARADEAALLCIDLTQAELPEAAFDLWHDRAVFHFLTEPGQRAAYLTRMKRALKPGGFVVLGCFAPDGPEKCSGLPVRRYDAAGIAAELGPEFELLEEGRETHSTPFGTTQAFTVVRFRFKG